MDELIDSYKGCELVLGEKYNFYYPDGDTETVRQFISIGETPEEDITYYKIGKEIGTDLKIVFRDHVRSAV